MIAETGALVGIAGIVAWVTVFLVASDRRHRHRSLADEATAWLRDQDRS